VTPNQFALVQQLASGDFISGKTLGDVMGISRAAIWKQLQQLQAFGLEVESVKGRGYRITGGLDLLDQQAVRCELSAQSRACIRDLHVAPVIDSTNSWLLRQLNAGAVMPGSACLAEQQTQGKGRRGRQWISPFARNLYCSLCWEFEQGIGALEGLSLAVGVAAVTALERLGLAGLALKWPNDLLWHDRKLGGVLLEVSGEASGVCQVVIGIGLNIQMPAPAAAAIDQPWVDLAEVAGGTAQVPPRSRVAGVLLDELVAMLCLFQDQGFAPFLEPWEALNAHAGQEIAVITPAKRISGRMLGINQQGALRLLVGEQELVFLGGEVSVRGAT
jgi:BirA family biotin operon repressor/biotin-[acetyl-CoA-carboxylase] ligase